MFLTPSGIKSFLGRLFKGRRSLKEPQRKDDNWHAVATSEPTSDLGDLGDLGYLPPSAASFPEDVEDTDSVSEVSGSVCVTRASVYIEEPVHARWSALLAMDSESSGEYELERSPAQLCRGPDIVLRLDPLTTFVHDVEADLLHPGAVRYDLSNSLDIETELNELMGTFKDGSAVNLGFAGDEESLGSSRSSGWTWEDRKRSRSERGRVPRGGEQRRSLRLGRLGAAYDRSSVLEPRVSSLVSLPGRPYSALLENTQCPVQTPRDSLRTSGGYDSEIDWSWLEDASKDLERREILENQKNHQQEPEDEVTGEELRACSASSGSSGSSGSSATERVDAECQTQSDQSWPGERVGRPASPLPSSSSLSPRPTAEDAMSREEHKPGSWLRQSMRRARRLELGEPSRRGRQSSGSAELPREAAPVETPVERPAETPQENQAYESDSTDRHPSPTGRRRRASPVEEPPECRSPLGPWPHGLSSVLAGLGCTLGLFNISRFAVLSVHFGGSFIVQFVLLSLILGVPLLAFHAALGQTLAAGPVDMWKISPLFQGIGIALLLAQALVGVYSVVGVSWMFVYFRDSFITKQDAYRWAEPFPLYRDDGLLSYSLNASWRLEQTVPDYLNFVVLQRHSLSSPDSAFGHLKFQLTFNLAVVWMIVFVSLSKGLRSYGKVVYVFSLVPALGTLVLCSKLFALTPMHRGLFPHTQWQEFFTNTKSWISAATEVMLTWNLLGAATMQVMSHNRVTKRLWRDVVAIALMTLSVLILAAFLGNTCQQLLASRGYSYIPSSFERMSTYPFLRPVNSPLPPSYATTPVRFMSHASLLTGDRVGKPGAVGESGFQVLRLATELMPAALSLLGGDVLSPFWTVLFYFTLILFGVAQQLAIWHCVITGIMAINVKALKHWETTITFFTCAAGFVLGLPMTTELGVFVVYFLDYCLGGSWWILLITLAQLCAVLMIRGRPFTGDRICLSLFGPPGACLSVWATPLLTFTWNVLTPVALLVVCITVFKTGGYRDLWAWRTGGRDYWPLWAREVGVFVQIVPLLAIPFVAVIQCYRFLSTGPPDIFDRLSNLYRPSGESSGLTDSSTATPTSGNTAAAGTTDTPPAEDPPPKYTPPPSYSTATGARIAKILRQSFRRSMRRLQSVLDRPEVSPPAPPVLPPPDYASVLVEMGQPPSETTNYTAADVANVLRSSFRRPAVVPTSQTQRTGRQQLSAANLP